MNARVIMQIKYPVIDMTLTEWTFANVGEFFRHDDIYYSHDEAFFNEYVLHHRFVDCSGAIFEVVGKDPIKKPWRYIFPLRRSRIVFQATGEHMSFSEVKDIILSRIQKMDGEEGKRAWLAEITKANTIRDLIVGVKK